MSLLGMIFKTNGVTIGEKSPTEDFVGSGGIVVDAAISEEHTTSCDLTKNPVEEGAKITDHVQLEPAKLTIDGVISDSPLGAPFVQNFQNAKAAVLSKLTGESRSIDAYQKLLELQKSREPFTVTTGLKKYNNMIMTSLSVPRTVSTSNSIHFKATMEEIRIVKSKSALGGLAKQVKKSARNLASKTRQMTQKITDTVPSKDPLSATPSATTQASRSQQLFQINNDIHNLAQRGLNAQ